MPYSNIFILGASRGIGLEFVKQYAALPTTKILFATCRANSGAKLKELADTHSNIKILELDVKDYANHESIKNEVEKQVGDEGIDLLINNAGILFRDKFEATTRHEMMETYEVNVVAPLLFTRTFLPLLKASVKSGKRTLVATISSFLGSISLNTTGDYYSYRSSKAAMNQVVKSLSIQLKPDNIIAFGLHPGWVRTDMGGKDATMGVEESVSNMLKVIEAAKPEGAGLLHQHDGEILAP